MEDKIVFKVFISIVLIVLINVVVHAYVFTFEFYDADRYAIFFYNPLLTLFLFLVLWLFTINTNPSYSVFFRKTFIISASIYVLFFVVLIGLLNLGGS